MRAGCRKTDDHRTVLWLVFKAESTRLSDTIRCPQGNGERNILGRCQTQLALTNLLGIRHVRLPGLLSMSHFYCISRRWLTGSLSAMNVFEVREEVGMGRSPAERLASVGAGGGLVGGEDGAEWSECVV